MWSNEVRKTLTLVSLLVLLVACGTQSTAGGVPGAQNSQTPGASQHSPTATQGNQNLCQKPSSIKGTISTISQVSSGNQTRSFLLDGTKEQQAAYPSVVVRVMTTTQVFEQQGEKCLTVSPNTLQVGQRVQVQSTGGTFQSSPPQIEATAIVIVPPTS